MTTILAADIGATNARFAAFEHGPGGLAMGPAVWLDSAGAGSFAGLLEALRGAGAPVDPGRADVVALAVPGPVRGGVACDPPNLSWGIDVSDPGALGLGRVVLLNDFEAQAWACLTGVMADALPVLDGALGAQGPLAVLGPGTGMGQAALLPDGRGGHVVLASEGGHALFPFQGQEEFAFQRFLLARTGRTQVVGDMVVSGSGLAAVHAFLSGEDLAPARVGAGLAGHPRTLRWAARFLGRACRNHVLQTAARGGLVVCGGVAAHNPALATDPAFAAEFLASDTHAELLAAVPVRLNARQDSGLWGAALFGARALGL
ncbi:glucokinase [Desulfocurvus vexinensis]|uniref:glucokinase n=1 Tax=Desulfocurvus vexinensis TaxID=399548 RepID=UPI00048DAD38|nr:glucokinase [Desulfocurvus vexinensis]